jgi:thiol-disulfide isomerase/thioredoxin
MFCSQALIAQTYMVKGQVYGTMLHQKHVYHIFEKQIAKVLIQDGKFAFQHKSDINKSFILHRIVFSDSSLQTIVDFENAVRIGKISAVKDIFKFVIDTNEVTLQIDLNKPLLTQVGGQTAEMYHKSQEINKEYLRLHQAKKMTLDELNIWRCQQELQLVNQYPRSPYAIVLLRNNFSPWNYDIREDIRIALDGLVVKNNNTKAVNELKLEYDSFVLKNAPKNEDMDFPVVRLTASSETVIPNLLLQYKEQYLVIDFWATWCRYCIEQHPKFMELNKSYEKNNDIRFLSISLDKNKAAWNKYTAEKPFPIDSYWLDMSISQDKRAIDLLGVNALPRYIIVNTKTGKVVRLNVKINDIETLLKEL